MWWIVVTNPFQMRGRRISIVRPADPSSQAVELSEREAEVLRLISRGLPVKTISHQLYVGMRTVETYMARELEKLGLKIRADLVPYALQQGWLADGCRYCHPLSGISLTRREFPRQTFCISTTASQSRISTLISNHVTDGTQGVIFQAHEWSDVINPLMSLQREWDTSSFEIIVIAIGSALALIGIDVVFVSRGIISPIYLVDAAIESVFVVGWITVSLYFRVYDYAFAKCGFAQYGKRFPLVEFMNRGASCSS
jgi:DNA-binding CsgD family transcriptional regulator